MTDVLQNFEFFPRQKRGKRLALRQLVGPVSLLLRVPVASGPIDKIVSEHRRVVRASRKVWLGVFGSNLSSQALELLKSRGQYLYVIQIGNPLAYKGIITGIAKSLSASEVRLVPHYYNENALTALVRFWVQLSSLEPVTLADLDELQVARTGTMALKLFQSRTSVAIVNRAEAKADR